MALCYTTFQSISLSLFHLPIGGNISCARGFGFIGISPRISGQRRVIQRGLVGFWAKQDGHTSGAASGSGAGGCFPGAGPSGRREGALRLVSPGRCPARGQPTDKGGLARQNGGGWCKNSPPDTLCRPASPCPPGRTRLRGARRVRLAGVSGVWNRINRLIRRTYAAICLTPRALPGNIDLVISRI